MNGKVMEIMYFSAGFFGYGEKGDFKQWSLAHFIPIILAVAAVILIWRFKDSIRTWKHERTARFIYAFIMIMCEMSYFWRLNYVGPGTDPDKSMMGFLPLQVCTWTMIFTSFMIMSESRRLFNLSFFLTMSAGILPLLFPAVISAMGPGYYRYYQYWGEHLLPIVGMYYMMFVHGYKVKAHGIPLTVGFLTLLAIPAVYVNSHFEDARYLYLKHDIYAMLDFLPDSVFLTALLMLSVVLVLLGIDYLIYRLVTRKRSEPGNEISAPGKKR